MYRPGTTRLTPVMKQYRDAKEAYPDAILFFRLGDFYEMFNDDAVVAARELSINLTSRNKGSVDPVPMAGVPYHAAHNYVAKLIAAGHRVAICDQIGDPSQIKGIVPRKVVRVLTPGLLTDGDQLDARRHNFLCALDVVGDQLGMALIDVSTGEMAACALAGRALLIAEIARADPAETLVPEELAALRESISLAAPRTALRSDAPLAQADVRGCLDDHVESPLFADAMRDHSLVAVRSAARVLRFAARNLPEATIPVRRIARHDPDANMRIDETAQTHLELVRGVDGKRKGSLLDTIDSTVTAAGARLLRRQLLAPLMDVPTIRRRLDAVEMFVKHARARAELREALARIGDIERLSVRASLRESTPRDLGTLRDSLHAVPDAVEAVRTISAIDGSTCLDVNVDGLASLRTRLEETLVDEPPPHTRNGGMLSSTWDSQLDELRQLRDRGTDLLSDMETRLREETMIPSLKIKYTRAFGWYIEVTKAHVDKASDDWVRKQTLTNAERYTSDALDELADKLMGAQERFAERERALFDQLVEEVGGHSEGLRTLAKTLAEWDVASGLGETAHRFEYARPDVDEGDVIEVLDGRHPVVELHVEAGRFVPNDTTLDLDGERLLLITGPNMAGKSTLMRQVSLITVLAQAGSFVPARAARIGIVDRVLSRVGANDNLARGESTFMVEMRETATILRDATSRSLVILDEIGRGTSTFDGLAIAWAVTEHLLETVRCRAMFATHYHELTELAARHEGIANYSVTAREQGGNIVFLHRLTPGGVNKSYGIAVARLAGLPEAVLGRANAILRTLEEGGAPMRPEAPEAQLDLFRHEPDQADLTQRSVCDQLRGIDADRMTPLEALQLIAKLKSDLDE